MLYTIDAGKYYVLLVERAARIADVYAGVVFGSIDFQRVGYIQAGVQFYSQRQTQYTEWSVAVTEKETPVFQ